MIIEVPLEVQPGKLLECFGSSSAFDILGIDLDVLMNALNKTDRTLGMLFSKIRRIDLETSRIYHDAHGEAGFRPDEPRSDGDTRSKRYEQIVGEERKAELDKNATDRETAVERARVYLINVYGYTP